MLNQVVDTSPADSSLPNEFEGLDLNLPVPPPPVPAFFSSAKNNFSSVTVPVAEHHNFPTTDEFLVGNRAAVMSSSQCDSSSSSVVYPIVDMSAVAAASSESVDSCIELESFLLKELEWMGFKQVDLNKQVLRKNGYNVEKSLDDLYGVAEWDPILEELCEMVSGNGSWVRFGEVTLGGLSLLLTDDVCGHSGIP